jgi:hypothetical protein
VGFLDLVGELLSLINFEKSEIVQPRKLVFLCGGKASNNVSAPYSLRELLLHRVATPGVPEKLGDAIVLLAEEAANALAKSNFSNLLDLEEFIAAVVHAVVLIVESPGSFCELGAFVKTVEIREKLIVVLPSDHKNSPSFITSGAIKYLEESYNATQILGFHWTIDKSTGVVSAPTYALDEMEKELPQAIGKVHRAHTEEQFNSGKKGHIICLTLAFCLLLRAAKFIEIKECFIRSSVQVDEITIKRCIDTLVICKLLKAVENGKLTYYVAQVDRIPIKIHWNTGTPNRKRDTLRWILRIASAIEKEEPFRNQIFGEHSNV